MVVRRTHFSAWIAILLFFSLILRFLLTVYRHMNADEFQHLHASWLVHLGYLPYKDFWENHSPLLYLLTAPILALFGEGTFTVLFIRILHSVAGVAIAGIVYMLARIEYDRSTSLLAVLLLSFSEIFLQKTIEIRTDQFLVLCWLLSLWLCLRASEKDSRLWMAGFTLGFGMLFSPKALVCAVAAAMIVLLQRKSRWGTILKREIFFFGGFLVPIALMGFYFTTKGIFNAWIESTILQNLSYPDTRGPYFLLLPQNLCFLLLGLTGIFLSWRSGRTSPLIIAALVPFAVLVFFMPSTFSQSALTFVPILAIYGGFALKKSLELQQRFELKQILFLTFTVLAGFVIPLVSLCIRASTTESNQKQFELLRYVLTHTNSDEPIFDGNAAYIFRKQAYYYGSLVEGLRYKIKRGEIKESVPESLKQNRCRVVLYDDRVADLPQSMQDFFRANYIDAGHENVLVAGLKLSAENIAGNRAIFRIEIPLLYRIDEAGIKNLRIDGKPYSNSVFLDKGTHELVSDGPLKTVTVRGVQR